MKRILNYLTAVALDREQGLGALCLKPILFVLSLIYRLGVVFMRRLYSVGLLPSFRASVPVISIGNITAGGTGKTPFVVTLFRLLKAEGFNPMVLTRGYMAGQGGVSDEAEMLKELIGPIVFVGANRVRIFQEAFVQGGFDCVILDDGFQHWSFVRDLDIVLLDSEAPFGNGSLIPCGILREPAAALRRAGVIVLTRSDQVSSGALSQLKSRVKQINPAAVVGEGIHAFASAWDIDSAQFFSVKDSPGPAGAFCAIGSPESFQRTLLGMGVEIKYFEAFADHYRFTAIDAQRISQECRLKDLKIIFITHKDADKVKLVRKAFSGVKIVTIGIEFQLTYGKTDIISSLRRLRCP